ncbi:MAG: PHP domain-containing protein, partial [Petrimonas sp.]|nr:PHP domain-containing protein [Petrimonas sp.]
MQPFIHLHVHSQYSLLDGQASIQRLVDKAVNDGMKAIALTDHGAMYGVKEFINYISKKNAPVNAAIKELKAKREKAAKEEASDKISEFDEKINEAKTKLFKPIIGCECYLARRDRFQQTDKIDGSGWHLIVLAKNLQGYKNLIKIVSKS